MPSTALPLPVARELAETEAVVRAEQQRRLRERLAAATDKARQGDPFPFIALQWGRLLSPAEVLADRSILDQAGPKLILDDFQRDIIASLFRPGIRSVWCKGNTGCGKGSAAAIAVCVYYAIWPDARVIISRDTAERAIKVVMGEVALWWRRMRLAPPHCRLQAQGILDERDRTHEVRIVNPDSTEGFTGTHAPHVLCVFDEATAESLTPFFPLVPTIAHKFLALANPRTTGGPFFDAFFDATDEPDKTQTVQTDDGGRRLITVGGDDMLNVRAGCLRHGTAPPGGLEIDGRSYLEGEPLALAHAARLAPIIPGQTCADEYRAICSRPDPDYVAVYGHGRFPQDDRGTGLFFRRSFGGPQAAWSRFDRLWQTGRHRARLRAYWPIRAFGIDVGGSTRGDPSILTCGGDRGVWRQFSVRLDDATALADWVIAIVQDQCWIDLTEGGLPVGVDGDGIGWGVCGLLRQKGVHVVAIRGNDLTEHPRAYTNLRAEMYGELAKRLDPDGRWGYQMPNRWARADLRQTAPLVFALPPDPHLVEELRAVERVYRPDGMRYAVTPKRRGPGLKEGTVTVEDRIKRSPDKADSCVYFYRALTVGGMSLDEALLKGFF